MVVLLVGDVVVGDDADTGAATVDLVIIVIEIVPVSAVSRNAEPLMVVVNVLIGVQLVDFEVLRDIWKYFWPVQSYQISGLGL